MPTIFAGASRSRAQHWIAAAPSALAAAALMLPIALVLAMRWGFLSFVIWDTKRYLKRCVESGVDGSLSMREFNAQIDDAAAERDMIGNRMRAAAKQLASVLKPRPRERVKGTPNRVPREISYWPALGLCLVLIGGALIWVAAFALLGFVYRLASL